MKQRELKKCAVCCRGVGHNQQLLFYHVKLRRMAINVPAVQAQTGLEMMLGNCAFLAQHMGPDEDMAKPLDEIDVLICFDCGLRYPLAALGEIVSDREEQGTHQTTHQKD